MKKIVYFILVSPLMIGAMDGSSKKLEILQKIQEIVHGQSYTATHDSSNPTKITYVKVSPNDIDDVQRIELIALLNRLPTREDTPEKAVVETDQTAEQSHGSVKQKKRRLCVLL